MNQPLLTAKLQKAFNGITLGEGIGYFEADALDEYIPKNSLEYLQIKNSHCTDNWEITAQEFKGWEKCITAVSYMDKKGLIYFLPIFMSNRVFYEQLDFLMTEGLYAGATTTTPNKYHDTLCSLLPDQMECLKAFYALRAEDEIARVKTPFVCDSCGREHIPWVKWNGISPEDYLRQSFSDTFRIYETLFAA